MSENFKTVRDVAQEITRDAPPRRPAHAEVDPYATPAIPHPCPRCHGARWLRVDIPEPTHPDFGKPIPCPDCADGRGSDPRQERLHRGGSILAMPAYRDLRFERFVPSPAQYAAYRLAMTFAERPKDRPLLTLIGPPGTGKSHLAAAIAFRFNELHNAPVFYTAQDLLARIQASFGIAHNELGHTDAVLHSLQHDAALLVIDELGAHYGTEWAEAQLYGIVNARYAAGRPTVLTSNVPIGDIGRRAGMPTGDPRWASRLTDIRMSTLLVLAGKDMRAQHVPEEAAKAPSFRRSSSVYHNNGDKQVVCSTCHCRPCYDITGIRCPTLRRQEGEQ